MDTVIGRDEIARIEERLGDGWTRNVHYRVPAGTGREVYGGEIILRGEDAPLSMVPLRVEWWREHGDGAADALRVSCVERRYQLGGEGPGGAVRERTDDLEATERYLRDEIGYEQAAIDTDMVI